MKLNREWHLANRMPKNATPQQRYVWHLEHEKHCTCRTMPERLRDQFRQQAEPRKPG